MKLLKTNKGWISINFSKATNIFSCLKFYLICLFILSAVNEVSLAQTEDTTRTPVQFPEESGNEQTRDSAETPYRMDILRQDIERYQLRDYGSTSRFYRQLEYRSPEDFLMSEQEGYQRYGREWERKINQQLLAILRETFKEDSEVMKLWKRLAPFLSFGIWEPYEVPITRVDYPDKVPVESSEEE